MDKNELIEIISELDRNLTASFDIILIGGAAMILYFGAKRTTRDIDVLILRGGASELRKAVKKVAEEHELPKDWLNDAAKGFAGILKSDFYHRLIPLEYTFENIRLYVLGRAELIALKIIALREQDLEDLELLLSDMVDNDKKVILEIMDHTSNFRPDWAQKMKYFLQEQGWKID
ncbi:hypothetical protein H8E88_04425 [candidate division KSB1 bacterium]|nr:hypothetical protein [candidate division KSB1 bacterium]